MSTLTTPHQDGFRHAGRMGAASGCLDVLALPYR